MKHFIIIRMIPFFLILLYFNVVKSQNHPDSLLLNKWGGKLEIGKENSIVLVFRIWRSNDSLKSCMDSPDQGVKDIPADSISINGNTVYIAIDTYKISFKGIFNPRDTSISGTFYQGAFTQEMLLKPFKLNRQQEPKKPYPYREIGVEFANEAVKLSGTITIPEGKGPFPAVVMITGSGPQDRNEEIFGHKPFMVIADYLSRNGFAVLRYDDRGTAKSTGDYKTAGIPEFASDAYSAFLYLKSYPGVDASNVGLLGHSEGGMIAPLLASKHPEIAFIIMMAGPGVRGDELLLLQSEQVYKSMQMPASVIKSDQETKKKIFEVIISEKDTAKIRSKIRKIYSNVDEAELAQLGINKSQLDLIAKQYTSTEMLSIIRFDPCPVLKKVKCPVLAMNGDKDMQVPSKQNLPAIQNCLSKGGNTQFVTKELWYLNHLFQSASTGAISEYYEIEETVSPDALDLIGEWLKSGVLKK